MIHEAQAKAQQRDRCRRVGGWLLQNWCKTIRLTINNSHWTCSARPKNKTKLKIHRLVFRFHCIFFRLPLVTLTCLSFSVISVPFARLGCESRMQTQRFVLIRFPLGSDRMFAFRKCAVSCNARRFFCWNSQQRPAGWLTCDSTSRSGLRICAGRVVLHLLDVCVFPFVLLPHWCGRVSLLFFALITARLSAPV